MERTPSVEIKWVTAPSDGIAPAILLTVHKGKRHTTPIQYLLNAPEGFARLVLEHKCRPGPGLRALILTDLSQAAQGGLGGLLLRLRQDGHAALRLVGPAGLHDAVEGLRDFVRWTHPALELTALTCAQQGCVYDDECVEVRPLWSSSLLWQVPQWLVTAAAAPAAGGGGDGGDGKPARSNKRRQQLRSAAPEVQQQREDEKAGITGHGPASDASDSEANGDGGVVGAEGGGAGAAGPPAVRGMPGHGETATPRRRRRRRQAGQATAAITGSDAANGGTGGGRGGGGEGGSTSGSGEGGEGGSEEGGLGLHCLASLRQSIQRASAAAASSLANAPGAAAAAAATAAAKRSGAATGKLKLPGARGGGRNGAARVSGVGPASGDSHPEPKPEPAAAWDSGSCSSTSTEGATAAAAGATLEGGSSGCGGGAVGRAARIRGAVTDGLASRAAASSAARHRRSSSGESTSSSSSSSTSSADSSSGSSDSGSHGAGADAEGSAAKRRRRECTATGKAVPVGAAATAAAKAANGGLNGREGADAPMDLFSELDRLFMSGAAAGGVRGFGCGRAAPSREDADRRGRGGGGTGGHSGRGGGGGTAVGPAAPAALALRSMVLERLRSASDGSRPAGKPAPANGQRKPAPALASATAATTRSPPAAAPVGARTAPAAPPLAAARPADQLPLGYLLYLKQTQQALLVVAAGDVAAARSLVSHPVTKLLRQAPPGLLLAVAHLGGSAEATRRRQHRLLMGQLPGPHVWPQGQLAGSGGIIGGGGGGDLAAPLAGLGHLGSARVTMRLNTVASAIFPLPYELRVRQRAVGKRHGGGGGEGGGRFAADRALEEAIAAATATAGAAEETAPGTAAAAVKGPAAGAVEQEEQRAAGEKGSKSERGRGQRSAKAPEEVQQPSEPSEPPQQHKQEPASVSPPSTPQQEEQQQGEQGEQQQNREQADDGSPGKQPAAAKPRAEGAPPGSAAAESNGCKAAARRTAVTASPQGRVAALLDTSIAAVADAAEGKAACRAGGAVLGADGGVAAVVVRWWEGAATGAGNGDDKAEPAAAAQQVLPRVETAQKALLEQRRGSGLAEMLLALRRVCPNLTRSSEAERLLAAPPPPSSRQQQEQQQQQVPPQPPVQGRQPLQTAESVNGGGTPPVQPSLPPQQPSHPQPLPTQQQQQQEQHQVSNHGWSSAGGSWHLDGGGGQPQEHLAATAEEELAAAAAAYGIPERVGSVMRPSYAYPYGTPGAIWSPTGPAQDQYGSGAAGGGGGPPPHHRPLNGGDMYGNGQRPWGDTHRPLGGEPSWPVDHAPPHHPPAQYPYPYHSAPPQPPPQRWQQQQYQQPHSLVSGPQRPPHHSTPAGVATQPGGPPGAPPAWGPTAAWHRPQQHWPAGPGPGQVLQGLSLVPLRAATPGYVPSGDAVLASPPRSDAAAAGEDLNRSTAARLRARLRATGAGIGAAGACLAAAAAVREAVAAGGSGGQAAGGGDNRASARRVRRRLMAPAAAGPAAAASSGAGGVDERPAAAGIAAAASTVAVAAGAVAVSSEGAGGAEAEAGARSNRDVALAVRRRLAAGAGAVVTAGPVGSSCPTLKVRHADVGAAVAAATGAADAGVTAVAAASATAVRSEELGAESVEEAKHGGTGESAGASGKAVTAAAGTAGAAAEVGPRGAGTEAAPDRRTALGARAAATLESYLSELNGRGAAGSGAAPPGASGNGSSARAAVEGTTGRTAAAAGDGPAASQRLQQQQQQQTAVDDVPPPACLLPGVAAAAAADAAAGGVGAPAVGDVCVLFLGTGSAEPSKYRGASAVLVRGVGPTRGSLLIDAGEGAYGAMVRWLGPRGAREQVASLALVWISHKHPDHLLGLPALLEARGPDAPPLLVVGPAEAGRWLARLAPLHPAWRFTFLHCAQFSGSAPPQRATPAPGQQPSPPHQQRQQQHYQQQRQQQQQWQAPPTDQLPAAPWQQPCYCCPPYNIDNQNGNGYSGSHTPNAMPYDAWRHDGGGKSAIAGPPAAGTSAAAAGPGPGSGKRPLSAAARLRWHQQQRNALPPAAAAVPPPPRPTAKGGAGGGGGAAVCGALGLVRWQSVAVHHCRDAWGLVLEHADGWKLVYSGDTRPCPALVAAGRGATLLVHEATFEPCLESQARSKRHSTSAEAAAVADAMGAYRTVLTHFSQRYPHISAGVEPAALPLRRRPVPAFDGMLVPMAALRDLPYIVPPLALALTEPDAGEAEPLAER